MRFVALATDYDGTLASQGRVHAEALAALRELRRSGRALILVTGRELDELLGIFPQIDVFDRVVAENGALLYCPSSAEHRVLGAPAPSTFVRELERRGVTPLSVGRSIVATVTPHETAVIEAVHDLGLELQVIFNKGAVMVLPAGVNKATGLAVALEDLKLSLRNVVAIGDAENDHAMLRAAQFGVAVSNALPALKQAADYASEKSHADAVVETMHHMMQDDLAQRAARASRHDVRVGSLRDGTVVTIPVVDHLLSVTGSTAQEATRFVRALLPRLSAHGYQSCIVDWGGHYAGLPGTVALGTPQRPAAAKELVTALLDNPTTSVVAALCGMPARTVRDLLAALPQAFDELRRRVGRPHCIVMEACEGSEELQAARRALAAACAETGVVLVGSGPLPAHGSVVRARSTVVALGAEGPSRMQSFLAGVQTAERPVLLTGDQPLGGEALLWSSQRPQGLLAFRPEPERQDDPPA